MKLGQFGVRIQIRQFRRRTYLASQDSRTGEPLEEPDTDADFGKEASCILRYGVGRLQTCKVAVDLKRIGTFMESFVERAQKQKTMDQNSSAQPSQKSQSQPQQRYFECSMCQKPGNFGRHCEEFAEAVDPMSTLTE